MVSKQKIPKVLELIRIYTVFIYERKYVFPTLNVVSMVVIYNIFS